MTEGRPATAEKSRASARAALVAVCTANLLLAVDLTAMALLLPHLSSWFHADAALLSWIQNAYPLALAATLPFAGRAARRRGPGAALVLGAALLALGMGVSALAPVVAVFVGGRLVAGAGAAVVLANGLALLRDRQPPDLLPRAVGISASCTAAGLWAGPVLVGVALEVVDARLVLAALATGGAALAVAALATIARPTSAGAGTDAASPPSPGSFRAASMTALAILATAVALHQSASTPWLALAAAIIGVAAWTLVVREARSGRGRLVPAPLGRSRAFGAAVLTGALAYAATAASQPFQSLLLAAQGWSSLGTGLFLLAVTAGIATGTLVSGRLVTRWGVRTTTVAGFVLAAAGMALLVPLGWATATAALGVAGNLVSGLGVGIASPQALAFGISLAADRDAASASSVLWTSRQASACIAYAAFALLLPDSGVPQLASSTMFAVSAALMAGAAVIAARAFPPLPARG